MFSQMSTSETKMLTKAFYYPHVNKAENLKAKVAFRYLLSKSKLNYDTASYDMYVFLRIQT